MLALVLATLHKYIHVIFFQKLFKDTFHHACFRGEVGGINPPLKMKHWGSKRSSTYAKIIRSLSLNPSIPDSKAHVPSTVWAIRFYHSWPDNQKGPTPWGMLYSVPCLACTSRDGLFWSVFLTFMRSTNIYWMLYCLPSSMQGPKDKIMSKNFNSYEPVETPPSSALPINFKRIVCWLLSPFKAHGCGVSECCWNYHIFRYFLYLQSRPFWSPVFRVFECHFSLMNSSSNLYWGNLLWIFALWASKSWYVP